MCRAITEPQIQRSYRNSLGKFPTGVAVVTTRDPGNRVMGMTISSLCSVSLTPQLISWCIDRRSRRYTDFAHAEEFVVSVLSEDQADVARLFAGRGNKEFFVEDDWAIPSIAGACASFSCIRYNQVLLGDHLMLIGRVRKFQSSDLRPLVFAESEFQQIAREQLCDANAA